MLNASPRFFPHQSCEGQWTWWQIRVRKDDYQHYEYPFDLRRGIHPRYIVKLARIRVSAPDDEEPAVKMATLAVRVIMGDRTDPRGANVVIRDAPGQLVASGSPDRGGIYSPPRRLPPGLYQIEVTKTGYAMRGGDVILAGRDLEKPFELPPLGGREEPPVVTKPKEEMPGVQSTVVEVLDLRSGAPLDGAQVVIGLGEDPEWPREQHYGKPKRGERPNWY